MAALSEWKVFWRAAMAWERESPARLWWGNGTWCEPNSHNLLREPSHRGGDQQMHTQACGKSTFLSLIKELVAEAFNNLLHLSFCTVGHFHIQDLGKVYCKTLVHDILESRTWKISPIKSIQMQIQALFSALHHILLLAAVHLSE